MTYRDTKKISLALAASMFMFGSGYACPPPDHLNPDPAESGGDDDDAEKELSPVEKFVDRSADCIDLDDCDGFPGRAKEGKEKGKRFPNFKTQTCDGDEWEFAELFRVHDDGEPIYKSIMFVAGANWCGPCKTEAKHLPELYREIEQFDAAIVSFNGEAARGTMSTPDSCQSGWSRDIVGKINKMDTVTEEEKEELLEYFKKLFIVVDNPEIQMWSWIDSATADFPSTSPPHAWVFNYNGEIQHKGWTSGQAPSLKTMEETAEEIYEQFQADWEDVLKDQAKFEDEHGASDDEDDKEDSESSTDDEADTDDAESNDGEDSSGDDSQSTEDEDSSSDEE